MYANSRPVSSDHTGSTVRTQCLVRRYRRHDYQRPIAVNNQQVFETLHALHARSALPLILDSGCGNGASTAALAENNPHALVIGIDKSAHRLRRRVLERNIYRQGNLVLAQADSGRLVPASSCHLLPQPVAETETPVAALVCTPRVPLSAAPWRRAGSAQ